MTDTQCATEHFGWWKDTCLRGFDQGESAGGSGGRTQEAVSATSLWNFRRSHQDESRFGCNSTCFNVWGYAKSPTTYGMMRRRHWTLRTFYRARGYYLESSRFIPVARLPKDVAAIPKDSDYFSLYASTRPADLCYYISGEQDLTKRKALINICFGTMFAWTLSIFKSQSSRECRKRPSPLYRKN